MIRRLPGAQERVWYFAETDEPVVALTIDDSPDPVTTDVIASVLARNGIPATFFITGDYTRDAPGVLERLVEAGHGLGNHLMSETPAIRLSPAVFREKLVACHALIAPFGTPRFFRPPSGFYRRVFVDIAQAHGYRTVLGDAFPFDTHIRSQRIRRSLLQKSVAPGSIIILHDRGRRGERTVETLYWMLPWLEARGLRIVPLEALFRDAL
ncbi:MAG: polysaccharide deacetylase family protein [Pseudomonadota bacterium]